MKNTWSFRFVRDFFMSLYERIIFHLAKGDIIMKVKTNFFEKVLLQLSRLLSSLSFTISRLIYKKHDPKGNFNSWSYDKKCNEITFSKRDES